MSHSKTLHPTDYHELEEYVRLFNKLKPLVPAQINHVHRMWEYSKCLDFIESLDVSSILDIGGGGSLFAPMATRLGYQVTVMDDAPQTRHINTQNYVLDIGIAHINRKFNYEEFLNHFEFGQFDVIVALSVIEHTEDDFQFLTDILDLGASGVFLTTDYSETGGTFSIDHLRTYTSDDMYQLADLGDGWILSEAAPDWKDNGVHVFGYNFASLALINV